MSSATLIAPVIVGVMAVLTLCVLVDRWAEIYGVDT